VSERFGSLTFAKRWLDCLAKGNVPNVGRQKIKLYRVGLRGRLSFQFSFLVCQYVFICLFHAVTVLFRLVGNVGSYTQVRTAGDFLSSRNAARAERYPPKTTAAGLAGS
jgi:hypothetical protein